MSLEVVFLGSSGAIQVPSFNCTCKVCQEARTNHTSRTRASLAIIGKQTTIIDTSPDLPAQLEREKIKQVNNVVLTHWHFDHVWGLSELVEPFFMSKWTPINIYLPEKSMHYFDNAMGYIRNVMNVTIHPVNPGDKIDIVDASIEVVKTNHTPDSVGYIVQGDRSLAYLLDSYIPCDETVKRVSGVDVVVLGPTIDDYVLLDGEDRWLHFSLDEAVEFWGGLNVDSCILSHLSCHSYIRGELVAGLSDEERSLFEKQNNGLKFAYDGLRVLL